MCRRRSPTIGSASAAPAGAARPSALAFTFCKDRPLDREAFRDPRAYLQRTLAAPKVTLSSRPIVQRHVNAFLLGSFMRERAGDALKMQIGAFLGCPADPKEARPPKDGTAGGEPSSSGLSARQPRARSGTASRR